jgi:O-acetyl-ADP-ribose deacetylase (regulator of RNase III)
MMITITRGNILEAGTEALVNTVNTVGVMGKGIALQFKRAFPANFTAYHSACERGELQPGRIFVFDRATLLPPRYIVNFPTKRHWRQPSRLEDIEAGLESLVAEIRSRGIRSIAIPPLGCGNGGLRWQDVRPRIEAALATLEAVDVQLYEPVGAPAAVAMVEGRERPRMTVSRAVLIELLAFYGEVGFSRTLLEIQKLAYFLQEAGEPLRLAYARGRYGPYAHNLDKALQRLEGHFLVGLGDDAKPQAEIELLPGAIEEAQEALAAQPEAKSRFDKVARLIEGYESPYGLELLASTHWVGRKEKPPAPDAAAASAAIREWTARKATLFSPEHVALAWGRLEAQGW